MGVRTGLPSNLSGDDGNCLRFFKVIFNQIKHIVCYIFNHSLTHSVYPSRLKQASAILFLNVSNPPESKQYAPIIIVYVLGKLMEIILCISFNIDKKTFLRILGW